jgi:hypothetical protein
MKRLMTILLFFPLLVSAQRVKFKDLVLLLPGYSLEQQSSELREYLSADPDHPNANFRMALVYEANYKKADPLTSYEYVLANAEQAKLRYLKSGILVDEKEVSHNDEYYAPIFKMYDAKGKPMVQFPVIKSRIKGGYDSAQIFINKIPPIYSAFTKSVNFYDLAVREFAKIVSEFTSIEDLYLMHDESLDLRLLKVKSNYDSSIAYLKKYTGLIKEYPILFHKQTYKIKPIVTYRLDGLLTTINFLSNNINLWDYSSWVDDVRKKINGEVTELRKKIVSANEKMDEGISTISSTIVAKLPSPIKVEKQLAFNINNLDRQSLILSLLDYKAFKQESDIQVKSAVFDTILSAHNAEILTRLIYTNRKADTLIGDFKNVVNPYKVAKHKQFVSKFYGGLPGLEKYGVEQGKEISKKFEEHKQELLKNVLGVNFSTESLLTKEGVVRNGKYAIPLTIQVPTIETLDQGLLITRFNRKNQDGSAYVAGILKSDKKRNLVTAFLSRIGADGKVAWFKELSVPIDSAIKDDSNTYFTVAIPTQEGCALVLRSVHISRGDVANTFYYFNDKGEEKSKKKLVEKTFPRFMLFNEKSNSFSVFLKGAEEKQNFTAAEPIQAIGINILGEIIWKNESIGLTGILSDVISLVDGYLLAGNYFILNDQSNKEIRTKMSVGECSPYIIKLSDRGVVMISKPFAAPSSFFMHKLVKVGDMSVHLLGHSQTMEAGAAGSFDPSEKIMHIMTNRTGQIISSSY